MAASFSGINHTDNYTDNNTYEYMDIGNHFRLLHRVYTGSQLAIIAVGSVINVWFLAAILSSPEVRLRVRNKIICNSFILHLFNCAIIMPIMRGVNYFKSAPLGCMYYIIMDNLNLMHELVANWLLIMVIAVFMAQVNDFNPRTRLTPRAATLGIVVLLVFPWIASLVIVPVIVNEYKRYISGTSFHCFIISMGAARILSSIGTTLPILLAVLLVVIAAVIRHRRFTPRDSRGSIEAELFGRGPEIDNTLPYVAAIIVSTVCDLLHVILDLRGYWFGRYHYLAFINTLFAAEILSDTRVILMPITWLLLPDLRQRIKTWRPWCCPASRIDLTVTYHKEDSNSPYMGFGGGNSKA